MFVYHFADRFIEPIRQGIKTQTIRRDDQLRHARPGELIRLCSGIRPFCQPILPDVPCLATMKIEISFHFAGVGLINRVTADTIPLRDLDAFALRDGFTNIEEMSAFFREHYPQTVTEGFTGTLIEWARPSEAMLEVAA